MVSTYVESAYPRYPRVSVEPVSPFREGAEYYRDFAKVYDMLKRLHAEAPAFTEYVLLDMVGRRTAKDLETVALVLGYWSEIFGTIAANAERRSSE